METAIPTDAEVRGLRRSLIAHGEGELLLKVLEKRLDTNPEPHSQARVCPTWPRRSMAARSRHRGARCVDPGDRGDAVNKHDLHERARDPRSGAIASRVRRGRGAVRRQARRKDDPPLIANLLMRAGEALDRTRTISGAASCTAASRSWRAAGRGVLRTGPRGRSARRHRRAGAHARQDVRARRHRHRADAGAGRRAASPGGDLPRQRRAPRQGFEPSSARSRPSRAGPRPAGCSSRAAANTRRRAR